MLQDDVEAALLIEGRHHHREGSIYRHGGQNCTPSTPEFEPQISRSFLGDGPDVHAGLEVTHLEPATREIGLLQERAYVFVPMTPFVLFQLLAADESDRRHEGQNRFGPVGWSRDNQKPSGLENATHLTQQQFETVLA